jgi:adenosine deaminase
MNNNFKILQKIKIDLFPLNSYYSFKNAKKIESSYYQNADLLEFKIDDEVIDAIFSDIKIGFFNSKSDEVKRIINMTNQGHDFLKIDRYKRELYKNKIQIENEGMEFAYWNCYLKICLKIAKQFFTIKDGRIYINGSNKDRSGFEVGDNYNNKFQWILIKQLIDQDILVGTYVVDKNIEENVAFDMWHGPLFTTDSVLEKKLEKGLAETHMHIGAAKRFSAIWTGLMNNKDKTKDEFKLNKIKLDYGNGSTNLSKDLYSARIIRLIMGCFLKEIHVKQVSFCECLNSKFNEEDKVNSVIDDFINQASNIDAVKISGIFNEVRDKLNFSYYDVSGVVLESTAKKRYKPKNKDYMYIYKGYLNNEILSGDILTSVFDDIYSYNSDQSIIEHNFKSVVMPESVLIYRALQYLKLHEDDILFSRCFWQYIKIKNIVYKLINQGIVDGKGLETFSKYYNIQSRIDVNGYFSEAFYSQIKDQNIKKMEFRMAPNSEIGQLKKALLYIFNLYKIMLSNRFIFDNNVKPVTLIGIVYHFIKKPDSVLENKCIFLHREFAEEQGISTFVRYSKQLEEYEQQAFNIARLRREIPALENYIVGIDAASKELDIDPYYFKKAYEILRNENSDNLTVNSDIGFTYHVGEDFRDIISGLRAVDETINVLNFKSGDRIGHGIVLGIDVEKWAEMNPVIYLQAEEYLDNLLWEWGLYTREREFFGLENLSYLEEQIFNIVEYIFGFSQGLRIRDIYNSYLQKISNSNHRLNKCELCKLASLTKEKFNIQNKEDVINYETWMSGLFYDAFCCKYFIKEFSKTVTINIDNFIIQKYKKLQDYMRKKISNRQIVIELNPSSNLTIGEFATFEDYHIANLSDPSKEDIIVTLNTDDPVVFNTNLSNEYALMYDIMMKKGKFSSKEIIEWLDVLRNNGIEYSFIKDRKMGPNEILEEVEGILEALKKL